MQRARKAGLMLAIVMGTCFVLGASATGSPSGKGNQRNRPLLEARTRKAGDARFRLPRGWEVAASVEPDNVKADKPYLHLQHTDGDKNVTQIIMFQARGTRGQLPKIARTAMSSERLGFEIEDDDVTVTEARQGYPVAYLRSTANSEKLGKRVEARAFAMKPRRMVEVLFYFTTAVRSERRSREDEIEAFVRALRFDSAKDPIFDPLEPRNSVHRLDLLTFSSTLRNQINLHGGLDVEVDYDYLVLSPNGRYTTDVPDNGRIEEIDWKAQREASPRRVGVYDLKREKGSAEARLILRTEDRYGFIDESEGKVTFEPMSDAVKGIELDGPHQIILSPLPSTRLRGRYNYIYGSGGSTGSSSGSSFGVKTIVLTRSGKFESSRFFSHSFSNDFGDTRSSGVSSSEAPTMKGRYSLEGYTLALTYDDGTVAERFCHQIVTEDADKAMLVIGESPYLYRGRR